MATTTTNFGWDIPQSTDLVKDGATAIAALGQDIDTALLDLKGGSTDQILAKNSGTDLDYKWIDNESQVLLSTTTLSGATTTISSISQSYKDLLVYIYAVELSTGADIRIKTPGTSAGFSGGTQLVNHFDQNASTTGANGEAYSAADGFKLTLPQTSSIGTENFWVIRFSNYTDAFGKPFAKYEGNYRGNTSANQFILNGVVSLGSSTATAINSLSIVASTGTFSAGTVKIYGVR